jgi:hypothetical protein
VQTFNRQSRIGWPYFSRSLSKADLARNQYYEACSNISALKDCFTTSNVRIQPEPRSKEREFQFFQADGSTVQCKVGEKERRIRVEWQEGTRVAGRTRLVFNLPAINLWLQIADTLANHAIGSCGACAHNMYGREVNSRVRAHVRALDVGHMERTTAAIIPVRTQLIGGRYQEFHEYIARSGIVAPVAGWKGFVLARDVIPGHVMQFGSGHSAVAPSQKELLLACMCEYYHTRKHQAPDRAAALALSGESAWLSHLNFGDDNFFSSQEPRELDEITAFLGQLMPVEPDPDNVFLGWSFDLDQRRFMLRPSSYLLKTYLHERAPGGVFREKPYLGWRLKREAYLKYGPPAVAKLFAEEDELLASAGIPWTLIRDRADREAAEVALGQDDVSVAYMLVFGKDYLLTEDQKISSGAYDGIGPADTARELLTLTSPNGILGHAHSEQFQTLTAAEVNTHKKVTEAAERTRRELASLGE